MKNIDDYRKEIDDNLKVFLKNKNVGSFLSEFVLRKGKRLRPILCMKAYHALAGKRKIIPAAISLELFHASTLVHDDIMDEDDKRRGMPSMHMIYKNKYNLRLNKQVSGIFSDSASRFSASAAIIEGNILSCLAFSSIAESDFPSELKNEAILLLADVVEKVNKGQLMDMVNEFRESSEKEYLEMISLKTASLISGSLEIGAIFSGNAWARKSLKEYGQHLGIAFQLKDDLLDISGKKGNTFGSDIRKGKKTLLLSHALRHSSQSQKALLKGVIGKESSESEIKKAIGIYESTGAIEACSCIISEKLEFAKKSISQLKGKIDEQHFEFFLNLSDYVKKRMD
ncbi:polyprenyl synthetase family protein [Candidatus Woesearchaeota archaeon]|nr:polyprenyl synthetase family protein [Candidatus Woesearchaeota archaeon]